MEDRLENSDSPSPEEASPLAEASSGEEGAESPSLEKVTSGPENPSLAEEPPPAPSLWCVAYVKPRCEKKMEKYCTDHQISCQLPTYESVRKYPRKKVVFYKPYFPGYVFICTPEANHSLLKKSEHLARLIKVADQALFVSQLEAVLAAIHSGLEILIVPGIRPGIQVRIKHGPLRGVEGTVERLQGHCKVYLGVEMLNQSIQVETELTDLEVIDD